MFRNRGVFLTFFEKFFPCIDRIFEQNFRASSKSDRNFWLYGNPFSAKKIDFWDFVKFFDAKKPFLNGPS